MAVIRIKRGLNAAIPLATGSQGELAVSTDTRQLYIATTNGGNFQAVQIQAANVLNLPSTSLNSIRRSWMDI